MAKKTYGQGLEDILGAIGQYLGSPLAPQIPSGPSLNQQWQQASQGVPNMGETAQAVLNAPQGALPSLQYSPDYMKQISQQSPKAPPQQVGGDVPNFSQSTLGGGTTPSQRPAVANSTPSAQVKTQPGVHTVQQGDTLWGIAQKYLGDGNRWHELTGHNIPHDPRSLQPGAQIGYASNLSGNMSKAPSAKKVG